MDEHRSFGLISGDDRFCFAPQPNSFLPSEAQWEYAARGAFYRTFPWGDEPPSQERMRYGQHRKGMTYRADTLPMADVNDELGMSPFGLHHMAGNVWQWCRDWYDDAFYSRHDASPAEPCEQARRPRSGVSGEGVGSVPLICAAVHFGVGDLRWRGGVAWDSAASVLWRMPSAHRSGQFAVVGELVRNR